jgi:phospholipase/carboxylesterase
MPHDRTPLADVDGPHGSQPVVTAGAPRGATETVLLCLHGRGATAQGIVNLLDPVTRHGVTVVAPQAQRSRWYPHAATAPVERNEPHLSSALAVVDTLLEWVEKTMAVPHERVVLLGFSQGAAVAAESAARAGGSSPVVVLSGALLGPTLDADDYEGQFDGAPVFLGCGAEDPHVPVERVHETAAVFRALGAAVTEQVYDGVGHEVTDDEFSFVDNLLATLMDGP